MPPPQLSPAIQSISNVRLHSNNPKTTPSTYGLTFSDQQTLQSLLPTTSSNNSPLALPALTHPHIHLDKAYIHNSPSYTNHHPKTGSFQEALTLTTQAKSIFTLPDLHARGEWLLSESLLNGVTALRAFIEIDHTVHHKCLHTALTLKSQWRTHCHIQVVAFAQDPLFSGPWAAENRHEIQSALQHHPDNIDVIGSTPYVESDRTAAEQNIRWAITTALEWDKHVDFHLDYNLDPGKGALVWFVLDCLREYGWVERSRKRVMLGHCTRFTLFGHDEWDRLAREVEGLPVSFVGLPSSDLYMAAPVGSSCCSEEERAGDRDRDRVRGTLRVPELVKRYGLDVCLGVNNVGNAFTPWGSVDPLALACLGVGVYQAGTAQDAELLYECVSTRARAAIGLEGDEGLWVKEGRADLVLFFDVDETGCGVVRPRGSVAEVVWDPPARVARAVVVGGRLVRGRAALWDDEAFRFV
ncbi:hypothetical protein ETB97_008757 [Aspergillus alliaceus]|uniref:Metallo-dependent hydrolase n=1 Tax=Petromyces alliaceus TaxID=209559 RepID=A0A8H6ABH6_PETAA|nr:hypothetical protein ETB97_008757 [Aspergillus burnettii]